MAKSQFVQGSPALFFSLSGQDMTLGAVLHSDRDTQLSLGGSFILALLLAWPLLYRSPGRQPRLEQPESYPHISTPPLKATARHRADQCKAVLAIPPLGCALAWVHAAEGKDTVCSVSSPEVGRGAG